MTEEKRYSSSPDSSAMAAMLNMPMRKSITSQSTYVFISLVLATLAAMPMNAAKAMIAHIGTFLNLARAMRPARITLTIRAPTASLTGVV